jgi:hypothetical protein
VEERARGGEDLRPERAAGFFLAALNDASLEEYYKTVFAMAQHHKYSISEVEDLYPFERTIYFEMLMDYLAEAKRRREEDTRRGRGGR